MPFPSEIRNLFLDRQSGKKCNDCDKPVTGSRAIAAHFDHDKSSSLYASADNGRILCPFHEALYHYRHISNPARIGMTPEGNERAVWSNILKMSKKEARKFRREFLEVYEYLKKKYS